MRASVVIPIYQRVDLTRACLAALLRAGLDGVELVLVDNASTDRTRNLLDEMEGSTRIVRNPTNLGFAKACNQGAELAQSPNLIFLNTDTEVQEGWLDPLLEAIDDPVVGFAGSRLLYPNGRVQHAGMALMPGCIPWHIHRGVPGDHPVATQTRDMAILTAACVAIRRDLFVDEDGFDEGYRNGFEDTDLCLRLASRGLVARYCGDSVVTHHESMSPGRLDDDGHNMVRFRTRWLRWVPDWDRLLREDGLGLVGPAGTTWSGPLLDTSPEATFGRSAVADLDAAGLRPLARETVVGPCAAGMGSRFPDPLVKALNRWALAGPDLRAYRHLTASERLSDDELADPPIAVVGPGACPNHGSLSRARAILAVGRAASETAATLAPPSRVATLGIADRNIAEAAGRAAGAVSMGRPGVGWWGSVASDSAGRSLLGALAVDRSVRLVSPDGVKLGSGDPLAEYISDNFAPPIWIVDGPPIEGRARVWEQAAMAIGRGIVGRVSFGGERLGSEVADACEVARDIWVPLAADLDALVAAGRDPGAVAVVPVPVDVDLFHPPATRAPGPTIFLAPITWDTEGAWDLLLDAWVAEFAHDELVKLIVFAPDGGAAAGTQANDHVVAQGHDPEKIPDVELLLEPLPVAEVARLYQESDVVVRAVRRDDSGTEVARALACRRRVVATPVGGQADLVRGRDVFVVDGDNALASLTRSLRMAADGAAMGVPSMDVDRIVALRGVHAVRRIINARLELLLG